MKSNRRSQILVALFAGIMSLTLVIHDAEAKRLGGGKSFGRQSDNVTQKQVAPTQAAPAQQAAPSSTAAPAAAAKPAGNRWLGPLAGLAAGLGIAALLSHLGMGAALAEMLGSFLLIAALVIGAVFLYRMFRNARAPARTNPAFASANRAPLTPVVEPSFSTPAIGSAAGGPSGATSAVAAPATWSIPADFDVDNFLHITKMYFVRLQRAWDSGNQEDLRDFTTPEVFSEIKLDLLERGAGPNQTDVITLDAQLLGIEEKDEQTLASVRLSGTIRETADAPVEPFAEVWNLVKPRSAKASWVLAGIQQEH